MEGVPEASFGDALRHIDRAKVVRKLVATWQSGIPADAGCVLVPGESAVYEGTATADSGTPAHARLPLQELGLDLTPVHNDAWLATKETPPFQMTSNKIKAEANAAGQEAAAGRRAAILEATRAKAHDENLKVGKVAPAARSPLKPSSDGSSPQEPTTAAVASRQRVVALTPPSPPPPAVPSDGTVPVARGADMMLLLMRGGAPNVEVLSAKTVEDFLALGRKYAIPLPGQPVD